MVNQIREPSHSDEALGTQFEQAVTETNFLPLGSTAARTRLSVPAGRCHTDSHLPSARRTPRPACAISSSRMFRGSPPVRP